MKKLGKPVLAGVGAALVLAIGIGAFAISQIPPDPTWGESNSLCQAVLENDMFASKSTEDIESISSCAQETVESIVATRIAAKKAEDARALSATYSLSGTVHICTGLEVLELQGQLENNRGLGESETDPFAIFQLDNPQTLTVRDGGEGDGGKTAEVSMICLGHYSEEAVEKWRAYDGRHLTIQFAASDLTLPSDVRLPLSEPYTEGGGTVVS